MTTACEPADSVRDREGGYRPRRREVGLRLVLALVAPSPMARPGMGAHMVSTGMFTKIVPPGMVIRMVPPRTVTSMVRPGPGILL